MKPIASLQQMPAGILNIMIHPRGFVKWDFWKKFRDF